MPTAENNRRLALIDRLHDMAMAAIDNGKHPQDVIPQDYVLWWDHFVDGDRWLDDVLRHNLIADTDRRLGGLGCNQGERV
jgi:hypothetical protein